DLGPELRGLGLLPVALGIVAPPVSLELLGAPTLALELGRRGAEPGQGVAKPLGELRLVPLGLLVSRQRDLGPVHQGLPLSLPRRAGFLELAGVIRLEGVMPRDGPGQRL